MNQRISLFLSSFLLSLPSSQLMDDKKKNDKNFIEKFGLMILRLTQFYIPGMRGTPEGLRRQRSQFPFQPIWAEHLEDAISNVDSVMFLIEIVEMVSFELGEGLRKIFLSCHERGISVGAQNLPSLLFFIKNIRLSTLLILKVCGKRVIRTS